MKRKQHSRYTTSVCPTCGSPRYRIPPSNGISVEQTTHVGTSTRYLVRAHLDLGPPIIIHPFEIVEIGALGRKPGFRWRVGHRVCTLFAQAPLYSIADAETYLKEWADAYIASVLAKALRKV
jgi:hypothetical protein